MQTRAGDKFAGNVGDTRTLFPLLQMLHLDRPQSLKPYLDRLIERQEMHAQALLLTLLNEDPQRYALIYKSFGMVGAAINPAAFLGFMAEWNVFALGFEYLLRQTPEPLHYNFPFVEFYALEMSQRILGFPIDNWWELRAAQYTFMGLVRGEFASITIGAKIIEHRMTVRHSTEIIWPHLPENVRSLAAALYTQICGDPFPGFPGT
jgi:hypothetical protein